LRLTGLGSTGNDRTLRGPGGRLWQFATPQGKRRVHHKARHPLWFKPDWAYLEEGLPVPSRNDPERLLSGMLGAYALDIGGGYLVHGSPYSRGVGERNTHGCVRLLDDDLAVVYQTLDVGDLVLLR
jgi:L,D-transpeptidase YbiS